LVFSSMEPSTPYIYTLSLHDALPIFYVNSEDTAEVVVFDPKSLEVKNRFPIGVAKTPTGLAYDAKTNRLFIGCRNEPKMVVMDADRKSTRLNSSHVSISYAVFCLKKK